MNRILTTALILAAAPLFAAFAAPPAAETLMLDLDAAKGLTLEDGDRVAKWVSQAEAAARFEFVKRDEGRKEPGSGRPTLRKDIDALGGNSALVFKQQELVCMEEDAFDALTTGAGHTWIAVLAVHEQRVGLQNVNSFFGNLRNGGKYEGLWGCFNDDNTLWIGARNGLTFGRFDANNPQLLGPQLEPNRFYLVAGRMAAGTGKVKLELFINDTTAVAQVEFPVDVKANPSRMAIGQERDAIQHPGFESFDGEIARFQIFKGALSQDQLAAQFAALKRHYGLK